MSKGIILLDMPENCRDCKYFGLTCKIIEEKCNRYNQDGKPDWCPIKPIPEKMPEKDYSPIEDKHYFDGYDDGWNHCLNNILKEV